jgi:hypothetical protein
MKTLMKLEELATIEQLTDLLSGTQAVAFSVLGSKDEGYQWIQKELVRWRYLQLRRANRSRHRATTPCSCARPQ